MRTLASIFFVFVTCCLSAQANDWEKMKKSPAQIEVVNMASVPLQQSTEKKGWPRVPEQLTKNGAVIYMPTGNTGGIADITVTGDGYLFIACNYDYQGNDRGDWSEEAWDERQFRVKGWRKLSKNQMDGVLVNSGNREQVVFVKLVKKGDKLRIRCNKYDPPYPIILP